MHILPDVAGKDVIELGCGTAYVSTILMLCMPDEEDQPAEDPTTATLFWNALV